MNSTIIQDADRFRITKEYLSNESLSERKTFIKRFLQDHIDEENWTGLLKIILTDPNVSEQRLLGDHINLKDISAYRFNQQPYLYLNIFF
jgi:hypothetical protein